MYNDNDYENLHEFLINILDPIVSLNKDFFQNKTIYDIGSNIGVFSELICKYAPSYKEIHLFEPCASHFIYSQNLLKNYSNIHFNNFGLGANNKTMTLYKPHQASGWNTFLKEDPNQPEMFYESMLKEECEIRTLDSYNGTDCDFIKIDVEGFECYVLEGGMNFIKQHRPIMLIEVGWGMSHPNWNNHNKFIYRRLFEEANYKSVEFKNETQDIVFFPKEIVP